MTDQTPTRTAEECRERYYAYTRAFRWTTAQTAEEYIDGARRYAGMPTVHEIPGHPISEHIGVLTGHYSQAVS